MKTPLALLALATGLFASASASHAQTPPTPASAEKTAPEKKPAPEKKSSSANTPAAKSEKSDKKTPTPATTPAPGSAAAGVRQMETNFGKEREARINESKLLRERLQAAKTEEEKERILAELRQQQQQRIEQQREIARQIREQMQSKRDGPAITSPRP